jgi:hypothetical protein
MILPKRQFPLAPSSLVFQDDCVPKLHLLQKVFFRRNGPAQNLSERNASVLLRDPIQVGDSLWTETKSELLPFGFHWSTLGDLHLLRS